MEGSVKTLMEAEKDSRRIVDEAMKEKNKKIAESKIHAEQELNKLRKEMETNFKKESDKKMEGQKDLAKLDDQLVEEMRAIEEQYNSNKAAVIQMLLGQIKNVKLEVGRAVRDDYEDLEL